VPRTKLAESFAETTELARRKDLAFNHFRLNEDRQRYSFLRSKAHLGARLQSGANGTVLGPQRGSVASGLQKMSHGNNVGFGSWSCDNAAGGSLTGLGCDAPCSASIFEHIFSISTRGQAWSTVWQGVVTLIRDDVRALYAPTAVIIGFILTIFSTRVKL